MLITPRRQRRVGTWMLAVGWAAVAVAAGLVVAGLLGPRGARDQMVGVGLAVLMAGLYVILWGRYVVHRAEDDAP